MTKDCTQPLRIGNIRALNGCAGRLFAAATLHNHKNSANKSKRKAMNRKWYNQKANPALKGQENDKRLHTTPEDSKYKSIKWMSRKPAFCICENKDADQLRRNCAADQRLCFRYTDSTIPLLPKSEISSL